MFRRSLPLVVIIAGVLAPTAHAELVTLGSDLKADAASSPPRPTARARSG
jgi:hypothetical protein